jgi:hypothetical protein
MLECENEVEGLTGEMSQLRSDTQGEGNEIGEQSLRSKLRDLQVMRAEIDEDIMSLQRVLNIMGGASP